MKLGETVTYPNLEEMFLCWNVPVQSARPQCFGGRAECELIMAHTSQGPGSVGRR